MPGEVIEVWKTLPGLMISIVFATLFIGSTIPSIPKIWRLAGPQISFGWAIGWGQYVVGVLLAILVITPFFGLPPLAGALIEIAFEGGHGTVAWLVGIFEKLDFPEVYDLSIGLATVGLLFGLVIGIILIKWEVRRNKTEIVKNVEGFSKLKKQGIMEFQ